MASVDKAALALAKKMESQVTAHTAQLADKANKSDVSSLQTEVPKKADKTYVDTQILSLGKVELKGVYATLSELQSAFPTGSTGIFVVTADGFSYYWNGTAWTKGTQFQGTAISPKSVTSDKLAFDPIIGKKGKNLFNKATAFLNQNINTTTGVLSESAGVFTSDFIEVKSSTTYALTKFAADSVMIVYFDSAKQIISSASNPASITTPANAMFVRFRTTMAGLDIAQFEEGAVKTGYEPYGITPQYVRENSLDPSVLKKGITPEKTTFFENGKNLFNKDAVTSGYFVSSSTGNLSANASYVASEFIPIVPIETYARSYINQIAFYDSNKVYITGIPTAEATTSFTAPANAYFVRVTVWAEYVATYQLERGTNLTAYESFGSKVAKKFLPANIVSSGIKLITPADILREFINRGQPFKVKLMGDSIMHGAGGTGRADDGDLIPGTTFRMNPNGYCMANSLRDLLEGKYNAQVVNYAQSGTNSSIMYDQRNTLIEDDDDILIMQIGTNDRGNLESTTLLKQHQRGIIEAAYAKGVKVILMSACPATVEGDNDPIRKFGMYDVDKAIRELANEYNMEHISNYDAFLQYTEFRNINMDTLLADGLHPNDAGYDVMFHNIVRNLGISYRRPGITK